jgi:hypothetical protein
LKRTTSSGKSWHKSCCDNPPHPKHKTPSSEWHCQFLDTGIKLNNDFLCFTKQMLRILCVLYNIEEVVERIWFCD